MVKTMVIFRVWHLAFDDDVIALFPCQESGIIGQYCMTYERTGQHGDALYSHIIDLTSPATPEEAMPLADELKGLGYSLSVRQRAPSAAYREKWKAMGND